MPTKKRPPTPDFLEVLQQLAKQQTEHGEALLKGIQQIGTKADDDRQQFKEALHAVRVSTDNNTQALTELRQDLAVKAKDCLAHDLEIKALREEVTGTKPSDTCSVKSRVGILEGKHRDLQTAFEGFRDHHDDSAKTFRTDIETRVASLETSRTEAIKTGGTWAIKILWGVIVLLSMGLGALAKAYYSDVLHPAAPVHTQTK